MSDTNNNLEELFFEEDIHLNHLAELVKQSIKEEELLTTKLIEMDEEGAFSFGEKCADRVASFGGSWSFIITFGVFIAFWVLLNSLWINNKSLDPYPFIFLNLILSCIAAIQAPIIMMSQNRKEDKDRRRLKSDYMINLKAEMELRGLHQKIDLMMAEQMQSLFKFQKEQINLLLELKEMKKEK